MDKKTQSNLFAGDLTVDNLGRVEELMQNTKGDNGELLGIAPDTIWIPNDAALKKAAFAAAGSDKDPESEQQRLQLPGGPVEHPGGSLSHLGAADPGQDGQALDPAGQQLHPGERRSPSSRTG